MRVLPFVIAALLACAASPAFPQSPPSAPEPPPGAQPAPPAAPPAALPPKTESVVPKTPPLADSNAPARASRFSFNRVDDGFLRLDSQTGQVAYCSVRAVGWSCEIVPEDRTALENEITRLRGEVASLKAELESLREPPPRPPAELTPAPPAPPATADEDRDTTKLREDLERARLAFENAWRRLVDMIINLQKDLARRG